MNRCLILYSTTDGHTKKICDYIAHNLDKVNKISVAEMALGFMLMLIRNLYSTSNELKNGNWNKSGGFHLSEKTVGIIGVGNTGKELVRLLKPFSCKILVNDIINQDKYYKKNNLEETSKKEVFINSDIVTIHTPYNHATNNMVNRKILKSLLELMIRVALRCQNF